MFAFLEGWVSSPWGHAGVLSKCKGEAGTFALLQVSLLSPSLLTAPGHPSHHCHPGTPLRADWWHGLVLIYFSLALLLSMSGKWRFRSCPNLQNVANALSFSKQRLNCHTTVQQCVHGHGVQHHGRFTFILAFHFLTSYK